MSLNFCLAVVEFLLEKKKWDATKVANHSSKCTKLDTEMKVADVRWINNTFELSTSYLGKVQSAMAYFKMYSIK